MTPTCSFSPVHLRYSAALRGLVPTDQTDGFTYAALGTMDTEELLNLATSNPEGSFFAVIDDAAARAQANLQRTSRKIENITFLSQTADLPKNLQFLCLHTDGSLASFETVRKQFALAGTHLAPGCLLTVHYGAYAGADEILQFLAAELAPAMTPEQALEFLTEVRALGPLYFDTHAIARAALDKAIVAKDPKIFFDACACATPPVSGTLETMEALLAQGLAFVGDADIATNYLELAAPASSHQILLECRDHLLYEPLKDFTLQRLVRNDIWVKLPAEQSSDPAALFGTLVFGSLTSREKIPAQITTRSGKSIDLTMQPLAAILDIACLLPMSVGDFLSHPSGKAYDAESILTALQVLIACGIVQPMRARYVPEADVQLTALLPAEAIRACLNEMTIDTPAISLASTTVGRAVPLSAREAIVLQAIGRVGLSHSTGAVLTELQQLVQRNPALAAKIMDTVHPSPEMAENMVHGVLSQAMIKWYAYGLLAA